MTMGFSRSTVVLLNLRESEFRTSFSSLVTILADCAPERVVNILVPNDRPMVTESGAGCADKLYQTLSDKLSYKNLLLVLSIRKV